MFILLKIKYSYFNKNYIYSFKKYYLVMYWKFFFEQIVDIQVKDVINEFFLYKLKKYLYYDFLFNY